MRRWRATGSVSLSFFDQAALRVPPVFDEAANRRLHGAVQRGAISQAGRPMKHRSVADRFFSTAAMSALLLTAACTTEIPFEPVSAVRPATSAIISPNVDLDQPNLILHYKNMQGVVVDVIPPWGSAVAVYATDNIRFDHFTRDGWVVVYNTFDVQQTNARPVLILYNKYRGNLRWWWWNDQVPAGPSNYLTYALMIDGNNTSALNFAGEFAKNYAVRSSHPFVVKTNSASFNQGLLNQAWYYFDTQFAYDPQITGQPQASYSLAMNGWATSESKIKLSGDINGTINGTINGSGKGVNLFGSLIGSITSTSYENAVTVMDNGAKADASLKNKINTAIGGGLSDAIKSSLNQLATQGLQILSSPLSNLFGSIISSDPTPQQKVELNLAAKINVSGDITTDVPAVKFTGAIPGTTRGDPSGYLPYYNETLGLFNLAAPPVVRWKVVTGLYPPPSGGQKDVQYFSVTPSVVLNPAIAGEVTLSQVTASLIYIKTYSGKETFTNSNYLASTNFTNWAVVNNVFGNVWYGFSAPYAIRYDYWSGIPEQNIVVRVKFTVSPTNGSPPVEVVKLYKPTFVPY